MDVRDEVVIDRPREAVFEFMDVPENQGRLSPRLSSVRTRGTLDGGGKRASYTYSLFGLAFEGEVRGVEHEPPERIVFEMVGDIEGRIEWRFEPTDGGTRVTYAAEYDLGLPSILETLAGPLVAWFNRRELTATLHNLQEAV